MADIDPAVARKLPAAVDRIEVMAMPVMAMPVVVMAVPVVAMVAVAMMAVAVTTVLAAGEGLARDGQRTGRQRQSRDSGHNRLHDLGHERLLGCAGQDRPAMSQPRETGCDGM